MREHLYRGKCIFIGKWVFGSLLTTDGACLISEKGKAKGWVDGDVSYSTNWVQVDPSTVGQFTGLLDKKGVRIFEGDVVAYSSTEFQTLIVCHGLYNENGENCAPSENYGWFLKSIQIQGKKQQYAQPMHCIDGKAAMWPRHCADSPLGIPTLIIEIIGNIADNPELLEVK